MSPPADKNPYRELAALLRAVPEGQRYLIPIRLRGKVEGVDSLCGCAFGATYPKVQELPFACLARIYVDGQVPPEKILDKLPEAHKHASVQRDFYEWTRSLGGDYEFLVNTMNENDNFFSGKEPKEDCAARYQHMLKYLDAQAELRDRIDAVDKALYQKAKEHE